MAFKMSEDFILGFNASSKFPSFSAFVVNCQCFCFVVSSDAVQVQED